MKMHTVTFNLYESKSSRKRSSALNAMAYAIPYSALLFSTLLFQPATQAAVTTTGCSGDSSCTMTQLLNGDTINAGALTFTNFDDISADDMPNTDSITITGIDDGTLDPGPGFTFNASSDFSLEAGSDFSYRFDFDITAAGGSSIIKDASLELTGFSGVNGSTDTVKIRALIPSSDPLPAELMVTDIDNMLFDTFDFAASVSNINVDHRIDLEASGNGVSLSSYDFILSVVTIPAALPLMLAGLAMLGGVASRRARRHCGCSDQGQ